MIPPLDPQYPRVRAMTFCPSCEGRKDVGLLVCWPCNRTLKAAHDGKFGPKIERRLAQLQETPA